MPARPSSAARRHARSNRSTFSGSYHSMSETTASARMVGCRFRVLRSASRNSSMKFGRSTVSLPKRASTSSAPSVGASSSRSSTLAMKFSGSASASFATGRTVARRRRRGMPGGTSSISRHAHPRQS